MRWLMNLIVTGFLFFPEKAFYAFPKDYGLSHEDVYFETQDGVRLHGWFLEAPQARATILFFHGNGGNISTRLFKVKGWIEQNVSVFLVDYRGYGKSRGRIAKQEDLLSDAEAALRWLEETKSIPSERILLCGESIGSYPAVSLASEGVFLGLLLESPFTSVVAMARLHYPWAPPFLLQDFLMKNDEKIAQAKVPVFIVHGDQDEICPVSMGKELFERAPSPKDLWLVQGAGHNDLVELAGKDYYERLFRFFIEGKRGAASR